MLLKVAAISALAMPFSAHAAGDSGTFSINQVFKSSNGRTIVFGSGIANPDSCATSN